MAMLSRTEALRFLRDILKIDSVQEKLTKDKAALLDEIVNLYQQKIPFQPLTVVSRSDNDQHLSTLDDIKSQVFSTQGGLCYDLNVFMKHLLDALGFEASFLACDIQLDGIYDHAAILVRNLAKPGDRHYVDVGSSDPFFQAIAMDFDKESPVYKCGFQFYKFVKEGDEIIWWQKVNRFYSTNPITENDIIIDGWKKYMRFNLKPKDIEDFREYVTKHYVTQNPPMPGFTFLHLMRAVVYPDQKLLTIRGTSLLRENDEGRIEKTKITSKEELAGLYAKYLPQLPADMVQIVIEKMKFKFGK